MTSALQRAKEERCFLGPPHSTEHFKKKKNSFFSKGVRWWRDMLAGRREMMHRVKSYVRPSELT